jgi:hypothetical protein
MSRLRRANALTCLLLVAAASCGGSQKTEGPNGKSTASDAAPKDGSSDGDGSNPPDADAVYGGPCTGTLDEVAQYWGSCSAAYEEALAKARNCPATGWERRSIGTCEGLRVVVYDWDTHGKACIYGGVGDSALVGASLFDDTHTFCSDASNGITGGRVPDSCAAPAQSWGNSLPDEQVVCLVHDLVGPAQPDSGKDGAIED